MLSFFQFAIYISSIVLMLFFFQIPWFGGGLHTHTSESKFKSVRITRPAHVYGDTNGTIANISEDKPNTRELIPRDNMELICFVEAPF